MAGIMVEMSLRASDELEYDRHTDRFILLLMQLADFWKTASKEPLFGTCRGISLTCPTPSST
jgi:hypothetical protein